MKNFPHQINQIPRLVQALSVFRDLTERGDDVNNDGVVGDAFARAGVYNFRERERSIEELLAEEHTKPRASQGTRTCARDLRRLFHLLGFLTETNTLSPDANRLIELRENPLGLEARAIWSTALDNMELSDPSGTSHPYRILLRLVREHPGISKEFLGLCLEANDDSQAEFERIKELATQPDPSAMWQEIGVSEHMAANSVKILRPLAHQLGDILESETGYHIGQPSVWAPKDEPTEATRSRAISARRPYDPTRPPEQRTRDDEKETRKSVRVYDPDLVGERYRAHEDCIRRFSQLVPENLELYEADYDLVVVATENALLVEVKTIRDDQPRQIRLALGQILFYEHMLVDPMYPNHDIHRFVITDTKLDPDLIALLERHHIGVMWLPSDNQPGHSPLASEILTRFGISPE